MCQDIKQESKCLECKHLKKSNYSVLENETLHDCWCKVGDMTNIKECDKFEYLSKSGESMLNEIKSMIEEVSNKVEKKNLYIEENKSIEEELLKATCKKISVFFKGIVESVSIMKEIIEIELKYNVFLNKHGRVSKRAVLIMDLYEKNVYIEIGKNIYLVYANDIDYVKSQDKKIVYMDENFDIVNSCVVLCDTYMNPYVYEVVCIFLDNKDDIEKNILKKVSEFKEKELKWNDEEIYTYKNAIENMKTFIDC